MGSKTPLRPDVVDADERVALDLPCVACGYNLRTLRVDSVCPECAAPVEQSLGQGFLCWSDHYWVETLANGAADLAVGTGLFVLFGGVSATVAATEFGEGALCVLTTLTALALIFELIGVVVVTEPEPDRPERLTRLPWRRPTRWCLSVAAVVFVGLVLLWFSAFATGLRPAGGPVLVLVAVAVMSLSAVGASFCLFMHLGSLMARVPRPGLARWARIEAYALGSVALFGSALLCVGIAGRMWSNLLEVLVTLVLLPAVGLVVIAALVILIAVTRALMDVRHQSAELLK